MLVEIVGFAQALARCLHFEKVDPADLEKALSDAGEPLELRFVEPASDTPLIGSGSAFTHLVFVQHGTIVPWQYPYSELAAPYLIGEHEFLSDAERWVASYSAVTEAIVVDIPVSVMRLIVERIPGVRDRMHQLVMRRLARFYWTSLATTGTPASRVAAALVSRLALEGDDYGENRKIRIQQKDLIRLTTMSRSAVADGLGSLVRDEAILLGSDPSARFTGKVTVPDVERLKYQAFAEIRDREIRSLFGRPDEDEPSLSVPSATGSPPGLATPMAATERPLEPARPMNFGSDRVPLEENATLFDGYVAVDWSANAAPVRGANGIWVAVCDKDGPVELANPDTRQEAINYIEALLDEATTQGGRLLCGLDLPFGFPRGTAGKLAGHDGWEALWAQIAEHIEDGPNNANNRLQVAARLNQRFEVEGPFWGNGLKRDIDGLPRKRPQDDWDGNLPPSLRYAERTVRGAQEVWRLNGAGSIGGQALTGIAALEGLRQRRDDVRVWPFQELGGGARSQHLLAEIYPSLIDPCPGNEALDARRVKAMAEALRELDRQGELESYLQAPNEMPPYVRHEEGAILGMDDPEGFRAAAASRSM